MDLYEALALPRVSRFVACHWNGTTNPVALVDIDEAFHVHAELLEPVAAKTELLRRARHSAAHRRSFEISVKVLTKLAKSRAPGALLVFLAEGDAWVTQWDMAELETLQQEPSARVLEIAERCDTKSGARDAVVELEPLWGKSLVGRLQLELLRVAVVDRWSDIERIFDRIDGLRRTVYAYALEHQQIVSITLTGLEIALDRRRRIEELQDFRGVRRH